MAIKPKRTFFVQFEHAKGFTLIELLVVVVIIGVLASLVMIGLNTSRSKARDAKRVTDIKQIQNALDLYFSSNNAYPAYVTPGQALMDAAGTTYMNKVPTNPLPTSDGACSGFEYNYAQINNGTNYRLIYCLGSQTGSSAAGLSTITNVGSNDILNGIVGWWPLNGDTNDYSGNNNNGTPTSITYTNGQVGQAGSFNGTSSRILLPSNAGLRIVSPFTISAWVKSTGAVLNYGYSIITKGNTATDLHGYELFMYNGYIYFYIDGVSSGNNATDTAGGVKINDGLWHSVVCVASGIGSNMYIYIDGVQRGVLAQTLDPDYSTEYNGYIGAGWTTGSGGIPTEFFPGLIDEFRIYNRALSAAEAAQLYKVQVAKHNDGQSICKNERL
ncbi:MAG: LamG-like jellyroll fold domain-containing protein [Candidatus Falkowbacteria bacterium]